MRVDFQPASPAQYSPLPLPLPSLSNIAAISGFLGSLTVAVRAMAAHLKKALARFAADFKPRAA